MHEGCSGRPLVCKLRMYLNQTTLTVALRCMASPGADKHHSVHSTLREYATRDTPQARRGESSGLLPRIVLSAHLPCSLYTCCVTSTSLDQSAFATPDYGAFHAMARPPQDSQQR